MCLSQPIEIEDLSRTEQKNYKDFIGWKVFRGLKQYHCLAFFRDKFTFQYQSTTLNYIPRRRWLKTTKMRADKTEQISYSRARGTYKEGFHIFLSHKNALLWRKLHNSGLNPLLIKKVKFKTDTSFGCETIDRIGHPLYEDNPNIYNCVVADQMLVL